jgi:hypothetical protein
MSRTFADRIRVVRKRVLAFAAVFFRAGAVGALLAWHVSDADADPGPVVYLFPVVFANVLGTFPTLAYFPNRWIRQFEVANCPACGAFLWPTTIHAVLVAVIPRCPRCWKRLAEPASEG